MTRYAAFLRGVNVGGVTLKMAEVAATMCDAGFTDVTTILATGNVLLTSPGDAAAVRTAAESALLYWQVPKGSTLTSTLGSTMGKTRYKSSTTTRNLRTLGKVLRG